jgi:uncharacterized protein (UPF0332 family)
MPLAAARRIRIAKATKVLFDQWGEGVDLVASAGLPIDQLRLHAASARLLLAYGHRRDGDLLLQARPPRSRSAISRFYYAMYHAMRAAVFVDHGGDDHEQHSVLPGHVPRNFPTPGVWQNALKSAREHRNKADYDPYPGAPATWSKIAATLKKDADQLLLLTKQYLVGKGCTIR